jgi:hypothetical protein
MALETVQVTSVHRLCTKNCMEIDIKTHFGRPCQPGYAILYMGKYVEIGYRFIIHNFAEPIATDGA